MSIEKEDIDNLLYARNTEHKENHTDRYIDHYLEQYRIYIHVFNTANDRRLKSNEFFLGVNTAIMGILGYMETRELATFPLIFLIVPFVGAALCLCWHRIIRSYRQSNKAKFLVIHSMEEKLPLSAYATEWKILGEGKDIKKYKSFSTTEMYIPIIFIVLYIFIFLAKFPWQEILNYLK